MTPISPAIAMPDPAALPSPNSGQDPRRVAGAAEQFESLLIGQMLKSMQESDSGGWTGTDGDDAAGPALELAQEQLAQAMAHNGGLGLARVVVRGLNPTGATATTDGGATASTRQP